VCGRPPPWPTAMSCTGGVRAVRGSSSAAVIFFSEETTMTGELDKRIGRESFGLASRPTNRSVQRTNTVFQALPKYNNYIR
jgi:hypothetical protein